MSAGILLLVLYGPYGTIGQLLSPRGITLVDTSAGIVLAQIFVSAPFVVVSSRAAFERIEPNYEEAAATMGASAWQSFWYVALPLALLALLIAGGTLLVLFALERFDWAPRLSGS